MKIEVVVASEKHLSYVTAINDAIDHAAKARGTGHRANICINMRQKQIFSHFFHRKKRKRLDTHHQQTIKQYIT